MNVVNEKKMINILKNRYLPFLFAIPLFFCVYHYNGIVMDAVLYVTQYVYSIDPARFAGDPAFEFGNQGSLGFFSPLFGLFVELFGVARGAFIFTFLMQFAWIVAAIFMINALLRLAGQRLWVLPVVVLFVVFFANGMPFSHIWFFHYVSSYACSRPLSIVLGIGALACLFNQRKYISLSLVVMGTIVHPITAGWCLPFWMFYFYPRIRRLILVLSFLFPFTFLLHSGVFDFFPNDWLERPLPYTLEYEMVSRYILLVVFFISVFKTSKNKFVQNISKSLLYLIVISLYWSVWGCFGEHIFLYQVQPWRAIWLPSIMAVPLGLCCGKNFIRNCLKKNGASTHDMGMLLLVISFLAPRNIVIISIVAVYFLLKENKVMTKMNLFFLLGAILFGGFLVQQYLTLFMLGQTPLVFFDYHDLYHLRDSFLIYQFVLSMIFSVYLFSKKRYVLGGLLFSSVFFPRIMLLPVIPMFLFFFPKEMGWKRVLFLHLIILVVLFDGLFDGEMRRHAAFDMMPLSFFWGCLGAFFSFLSIYLSKKISYLGVSIWIPICSIMAFFTYLMYSVNWLENEKMLDRYLYNSIFPQVKERGKMLFFVSGPYVGEPRLQFMTGSYFTHSVMIGGAFNKEHYRTALERSHLLYKENRDSQSDVFYDYGEIVGKFANVDTLVERFNYLCGIKEVTHLVTDKAGLPYVVEDSTIVLKEQKAYLYRCP